MDKHWLTIVIVVLIIVIILDGIRRMRRARHDSIKMSLRPLSRSEDALTDDNEYGSEFPNGGARASDKQIDANRIHKARSKYNFGDHLPNWSEKVSEKLADGFSSETNERKLEPRIEPSFDEASAPLAESISEPQQHETRYAEDYETTTGELQYSEPSMAHEEAIVSAAEAVEPDDAVALVKEEQVKEEQEQATTQQSTPVQASLNLEEAVPMLMDTLGDEDVREYESSSDEGDIAVSPTKPKTIVSVGTPIEPSLEETAPNDTYSANKPRYESKYVDHSQHQKEVPADVLVIHVKASKSEFFYGSDLLELILDNGLRFGDMNIFHYHTDADGEGPVLFSMANMVKPGTFDLHTFEEFSTVGLSFFLTLPTPNNRNMEAFESMLTTAQDIAKKLSGELNDEQRSVLTKQTIEHYRERIRDFARKQQLEKNK